MATSNYHLMPPPPAGRGRDLWLQHAAGLILFEDVRGYARERVDRGLDEVALQASFKAIDDVLYGLMMVMDGVTGQLTNGSETVRLTVNAELELKGALIQALNLRDEGDGMCMGFHGWLEGDYGEPLPAVPARRRIAEGEANEASQ